MTDRELMQQALDYIIETNRISSFQLVPASRLNQVITALRDRLAQPEQKPVAWMWADGTITTDPDRADGTWTPLYTAPRQWQGLTKGEVDAWDLPERPTVFEFAQFVEAKLKEKNG